MGIFRLGGTVITEGNLGCYHATEILLEQRAPIHLTDICADAC